MNGDKTRTTKILTRVILAILGFQILFIMNAGTHRNRIFKNRYTNLQ